ncbi:MAG: winged helix-turn-helix domain-containing protein [Myxococcales bacterium]|nr:winged helix-turn-helix domain-containing protein [Myxococcales bacterium]
MLLVVHDRGLALPARWARRSRVVSDRSGWVASAPVVLWASAPSGLRLEGVPAGERLLSPSVEVVRVARDLGWRRVVLLPDLDRETLGVALDDRDPIALDGATLVPSRAEIWREGRRVGLPPREAALVRRLAEVDGVVPVAQLLDGGSQEALEAVVARLRRRVGEPVVVAERGRGWRLRRAPAPAPPVPAATTWIAAGGLALDPVGREVRVDGTAITLGEREAALLAVLLRAGGGVVERAAVRAVVPLDDAAIDTLVHRLRRRLGADRIRTVRGRGWRVPTDAVQPPVTSEPPAAGPMSSADLERIVERHPLVTVVGGAGTELLRALARRRGWASFDVRGIAPERVLRWVERRTDHRVVLEGFDDPSPWADAVAALARVDRGLLVGAAGPLGHAREVVVDAGSPRDAARTAAAALDAWPEVVPGLQALSHFTGSFDRDDVTELAPGLDLASAVRRGLLEAGPLGWRVTAPARAALVDAGDEVRWASWVVATVERDFALRACPVTRIADRVPDLARAAQTLVDRGDPQGAAAMVVWAKVGRWGGANPTIDQLTRAIALAPDDDTHASLLLSAAQSDGVDGAAILDLARRGTALARTSVTRWLGRFVSANHAPDRLARCQELLARTDAPDDPAPADIRAGLLLLVGPGAHPETWRSRLAQSLTALEAARWSDEPGLEVAWLDEARVSTLVLLAQAWMGAGDDGAADAALIEASRLATPESSALVALVRSGLLARRGRWGDADRLLDELGWSPSVLGRPLTVLRVLSRRAVLAAMFGPRPLALALVDQLEAAMERAALTFVRDDVSRARSWLALDAGDLDGLATHVTAYASVTTRERLLTLAHWLADGSPDDAVHAELLAGSEQVSRDVLGVGRAIRLRVQAHRPT